MKPDMDRYEVDEEYRREVDHYVATRITNCAKCRTKTHAPTVIPRYARTYTINSAAVEVVIENFECRQCTTCGHMLVGDKGLEQIEEAYIRAGGKFKYPKLEE